MSEPTRPAAAAALVAAVLDAAPARLRRRLDADPALAEGWGWRSGSEEGSAVWVVDTGEERVELRPEGLHLTDLGELRCSCLLSPRCLHVLAVASVLEVVEGSASPDPDEVTGAAGPGAAGPGAEPVPTEVRAVAADALSAGSGLLADGVGASSRHRSELLRVAHDAHRIGLPRLASVAARAATELGALASERPEGALGALVEAVAELLVSAHGLARVEAADPDLIGAGRRAYRAVGGLVLHGVCCEAVVTASGFAGAVTHLVDDDGDVWTVADIRPGGIERCRPSAQGGCGLGDLSTSLHQLGRSRVVVSGGRATLDRRLGRGRGVQAMRTGRSGWDVAAVRARFDEPLTAQLDRALAVASPGGAAASDDPLRGPTGLVFVRGGVVAAVEGGFWFEPADDGHLLLVGTEPTAAGLSAVPVLERLGGAVGVTLEVVARVRLDRPRHLALLAVRLEDGPSDADTTRPSSSPDHLDVAFDRLDARGVPSAPRGTATGTPMGAPTGAPASGPGADPALQPLRRWLARVVAGGRVTLSVGGGTGLDADVTRLRAAGFPTGADLLEALRLAAAPLDRRPTGEVVDRPAEELGRAWTAAAVYLAAASAVRARQAWGAA